MIENGRYRRCEALCKSKDNFARPMSEDFCDDMESVFRFAVARDEWGDASSQNINDFVNLFGGIVQQGLIQGAQSEWRKVPLNEVDCIEQALVQQGTNVQALIQRGVMPIDPRLGQLRRLPY